MRRAGLVAVVAVGFAGCGDTGEDGAGATPTRTPSPTAAATSGGAPIDADRAQRFIADTVHRQAGARIARVTCPQDLTARRGATFRCRAVGTDGSTGPVTVTEKDDRGNVHVDAPFIHVRELERSLARDIAKQVGGRAELDCPEIVVGDEGGRFECVAVAGGDRATVRVTQTDDDGHVTYKLRG